MDSASPPTPKWLAQQPAAFDIATAFYPETRPRPDRRPRPCLILDVLRDKASGRFACSVAYGTSNLKVFQRLSKDIIVQNAADLAEIGLPMATRFDLDERNIVTLPWSEEFFTCWPRYPTPIIGALTEHYVRQYAFIMAVRQADKRDAEQD